MSNTPPLYKLLRDCDIGNKLVLQSLIISSFN